MRKRLATQSLADLAEDDTRLASETLDDPTGDGLAGDVPLEGADEPVWPASSITDRYLFGAEVGRGSTGRVRQAFDARLGRDVAVKELIAADPAQRARFAREASVTARLQHPSIVPIYDAGSLPNGEPFYCMKLVSGRSLHVAIEGASLDERLALVPRVLAVVEALAYAHSRQIIHRDLKPLNVLLGDFGETMVIDWGLARPLADLDAAPGPRRSASGSDVDDKLTVIGSVMGTPAFMPPEQAAGRQVDERADVYALGALLYNVLAGHPPYRGGGASAVLAQVLAGPPPLPLRAIHGLPMDLIAIAEKAMARHPEARYPSAREMADDLERFTTGQLVGARRYSALTLARRWLARHRPAVTVAAVLLAALAVTAGVSLRRVVSARDHAEAMSGLLTARENDLAIEHAEATVVRDPTLAVAWLARWKAAHADAWRARLVAEDALARGLAQHVFDLRAGVLRVAFSAADTRVTSVGVDGTVWVHELDGGRGRAIGRSGPVVGATFGAGGNPAVTWDVHGVVRVWDVPSGAVQVVETRDVQLRNVELVPGQRRLACGSADGTVRIWDLDGGPPRQLAQHPRAAYIRGFIAGGTSLVSVSMDGAIQITELATGRARTLTGHTAEVSAVAELPDGRLVSTSEDGTVRLWDLATGQASILGRHDDWIAALAVAPDGESFATASGDGTVRTWDARGPRLVLRGHKGLVYRLAFLPDGRLASISSDGNARLWDPGSGASVVLATGGAGRLRALAVSAAGKLATGGGNDVRVWDRLPPRARVLRGHTGAVLTAAWSARGDSFVTGSRDGSIRRWDPVSGSSRQIGEHPGWVYEVELAGEQVLSLGVEGALMLWDPASGAGRRVPGAEAQFLPELAPGGRRVAFVSYDERPFWVDLADWTVHRLDVDRVVHLEFFPDADHLAIGTRDGGVTLWDLRTDERRLLGVGPVPIRGLAGSPDGRRIVASFGSGPVLAWDVHGAQEILDVPADAGVFEFTADGRQLLLGAGPGAMRVHPLAGGRARVLRGPHERITSVTLSPDSRLVAMGNEDGVIRVCVLASGGCALLRGHDGPVHEVVFDPTSATLLSGGDDQTVRLWAMASVPFGPGEDDDLGLWLRALTTATIDPGSTRPRSPPAPR